MRFAWFGVLLVGCGSPAAIESPMPPVTQHQVSEGGASVTIKPPEKETLRTCALDMQSPFGGTAPGWRREMFDDKGRPRSKASSNFGSPVTYFDYQYDSLGRIVSASPYLFSYSGSELAVSFDTGTLYSLWTLDARDRITEQRYRNPDGSSSLVASYTYDDAGRLLSTDNASVVYGYDYDDRGFLAHESMVQPSASWSCHRTWAWTHGPVEKVEVQDETGRVSQRCVYLFDDSDRLTSAKCTYSAAVWQYEGGAVTMSLSQSGSITNVERLTGDCDAPLTRATFARAFVPLSPDPRPSREMMVRLQAAAVPSPYKECSAGPPFGGD
jgi:YD repeat-containing protein